MRFISTHAERFSRWRGHSGPITSAEWSPLGNRLATGSYDGSAIIWNADSMDPHFRLAHVRLVNGVRWSKDAALLATACADGHCHIWDTGTGELVSVLSRHTDDVNTLAWSPAGKHVVTVSEDGTGRMWSLAERELLDTILVHADHCMSVDWHPAKDLLATCGEDATIRIWDSSGQLLANWPQPGDLEMVRWSPDGKSLAAACDDGTGRILSSDGGLRTVLGSHAGAVKSVAWAPDSSAIATGSYDCSVTVWETVTGARVEQHRGPRLWPRALHWSPNGEAIVVGVQDGIPIILGLTGKPSPRFTIRKAQPQSLPTYGINAVAPAGRRWVAGLDDGTIRIWEPENKDSQVVRPGGDMPGEASLVNAIDYQADKEVVGYGCFSGEVGTVKLDGSLLMRSNVAAPVNAVAWSPTGVLFAAADYSGKITIFEYDAKTGLHLLHSFAPHDAAIKNLAWLDPDHLVTGATDRTLCVVNRQGKVELVLRGHGNLINCVSATRGTRRMLVASASRDRTVRIWDTATEKCEHVLIGHTESVKSVAWRPHSSVAWRDEFGKRLIRLRRACVGHDPRLRASRVLPTT